MYLQSNKVVLINLSTTKSCDLAHVAKLTRADTMAWDAGLMTVGNHVARLWQALRLVPRFRREKAERPRRHIGTIDLCEELGGKCRELRFQTARISSDGTSDAWWA